MGKRIIGRNPKFSPNIKCKTKKHWDGVYKWVHVGPTGTYSPLKLNSSGFLDRKCKYKVLRYNTPINGGSLILVHKIYSDHCN